MTHHYKLVKVDDVEQKPSKASKTMHVSLTDELNLEEMRANVWYLKPGDAMSHHTQNQQEELYYVLNGPGRIRVEDEILDVEEGTAISIPPETERQVLNDTEGEHVWLIIGAPPVENDGITLD